MLLKEVQRFQKLAGILKEEQELNEIEDKFTHYFTVENPETGEEAEASMFVHAWNYPGSYDDPGDSGVEIISTEGPDWVTDTMYDAELEKIEPDFGDLDIDESIAHYL